jgi:hypothetical protein
VHHAHYDPADDGAVILVKADSRSAPGCDAVIRLDHLKVELRADPLGVDIDKLPGDERSTASPFLRSNCRNSGFFDFSLQILCLLVSEPISWPVSLLVASGLVQIIEREPAFRILADGWIGPGIPFQ